MIKIDLLVIFYHQMNLDSVYRVGQKTGLFLRSDNFGSSNDRKACIIRQSFRILSRMKCTICMSVQLHILCLICINCQCPRSCIEFDNDAWVLLNFHSKYSTQSGSKLRGLFSVGALQQMVYHHKIWDTDQLQQVLIDSWAQLSQDTLNRAIDQLPKKTDDDYQGKGWSCWILSGLTIRPMC